MLKTVSVQNRPVHGQIIHNKPLILDPSKQITHIRPVTNHTYYTSRKVCYERNRLKLERKTGFCKYTQTSSEINMKTFSTLYKLLTNEKIPQMTMKTISGWHTRYSSVIQHVIAQGAVAIFGPPRAVAALAHELSAGFLASREQPATELLPLFTERANRPLSP